MRCRHVFQLKRRPRKGGRARCGNSRLVYGRGIMPYAGTVPSICVGEGTRGGIVAKNWVGVGGMVLAYMINVGRCFFVRRSVLSL